MGIFRIEGTERPWSPKATPTFPIKGRRLRNGLTPSFLTLSLVAVFISTLCSCGSKGGQFRFEGRFRNMNRGELYVYSTDGGTNGIDTIKVSDGRFSYETPLNDKATYIILFPNLSELAVFGESGSTAKISGDVSHLKEIEITGTEDNELMTKFKQNVNRLSPPEAAAAAAQFVEEHPNSIVSVYIVKRYFIQATEPDYSKASSLLAAIVKAQPNDGRIAKLKKQVDRLKASTKGNAMSNFNATDLKGKRIGKSELSSKVNIVSVWASWNFDSQEQQRKLDKLKKDHAGDIALLGVCIDANKEECRKIVERDSLKWPNVCDGLMWESPLLAQFGLGEVPGNVVFDSKGKVVARNLSPQKMKEKIESLLK